ncbi:MAG: hypothetical protein LBI03_03400 [Clostridiales bacterium]|nr:hypothetical protein [Clostridiales bacterium]
MDAVIEAILAIENRAKDMVKEAEEKKAAFDENISEEADKIKKELLEQTKKKLADQRVAYIEKSRETVEANKADAKGKLDAMEKYFQDNRENWIFELYKRIIEK